jgi:hypothetical protein
MVPISITGANAAAKNAQKKSEEKHNFRNNKK